VRTLRASTYDRLSLIAKRATIWPSIIMLVDQYADDGPGGCKGAIMSISLFAYLDSAPSLEEIRDSLAPLGVVYRHTLPPDERWGYPMHVFGRDGLRVVYHAGDPRQGEAVVDSTIGREDQQARVTLQLVLSAVVRRYGGTIYDPLLAGRGAVL
jgi:hypothetical protein